MRDSCHAVRGQTFKINDYLCEFDEKRQSETLLRSETLEIGFIRKTSGKWQKKQKQKVSPFDLNIICLGETVEMLKSLLCEA